MMPTICPLSMASNSTGLASVMAPFSRGKSRIDHKSHANRGQRISIRGPGRGGRRGDYAARAGNKGTFYSTRVEEQAQDASDNESQSLTSDNKDVDEEGSEPSSNSEDEDARPGTVQPYNALLLSLGASKQRSEPQSKKRKLDSNEIVSKPDVSDTGLDLVGESEESEDPGIDGPESETEAEHDAEEDYDPFSNILATWEMIRG